MANNVDNIISRVAKKHGLDVGLLRSFMQIESSGNPKARTGSYKGLFQLSDAEFKKYGPRKGNIYSAEDNAEAFAKRARSVMRSFKRRTGRDPTTSELYLTHQQGRAGTAAHAANPDGVAWKNIRPYYTDAAARKRGFRDGDAYAQAAIRGNLPKSVVERMGGVDKITSGDFVNWWDARVQRGMQGAGTNSIVPQRSAPIMSKRQDRIRGGDATQNTLSHRPLSPEQNEQAFGKPFGELFQNTLSGEAGGTTMARKGEPPKFLHVLGSIFS